MFRHIRWTGIRFFVPVQYLPQPGNFFFVATSSLIITTLVTPMGANTKLCLLMHRKRTNLYFQSLSLGSNNRRVQRPIPVVFRVSNVIIEFVGNVSPKAMHQAQRSVAISYIWHQNSHCANIINLRKTTALALHFSPNTIDMFCASRQLCFYTTVR